MPYMVQERQGKYYVYKEQDGAPTGDALGEHDSEEEAKKQLAALYASENHTAGDYLLDEFVNVRAGQPYRLFPFGVIVKNGKRRTITPEFAARFKLPHFKPPVKLGSHKEETPAGGHIVGLEVRADGLYAIPELNDDGAQALERGAYRYHSPEVIWDEDAGYEDPVTGAVITGPLIVGDALLHTPHLGEAAALYEVTPLDKEKSMTVENDTVQVPRGLWDVFSGWFKKRVEDAAPVAAELLPVEPPAIETPAPAPVEPPAAPENYAAQVEALQAERDAAKAELDAYKAEQAQAQRVAHYAAELATVKVGAGGETLAGMNDEQAAWVLQQFRALSAQVNESALVAEIGKDAPGESYADPRDALNAAVTARMKADNTDYMTALNALRAAQPDLFQAYNKPKE